MGSSDSSFRNVSRQHQSYGMMSKEDEKKSRTEKVVSYFHSGRKSDSSGPSLKTQGQTREA